MIREPTSDEMQGMMRAYLEHTKLNAEDVADFYAFVRTQYISDCPGYAGPVGFFHWSGGPHLITIFTKEPPSDASDRREWTLCAESNDLNLV